MRFRKKNLTSPRLRRKRRSRLMRSAFFVIFSIIILGGSLVFFLGSNFFLIKSIKVVGTNEILAEEAKSLVEKELSGTKLLFFSKGNFLFLDRSGIEDYLKEKFPIFSKVRPNLAGLGNLIIEVNERNEYAKWCDEAGENKCIFVDNEGFAFDLTKEEKATATMKIFTEGDPEYGAKILTESKWEFVKEISKGFDGLGERIVSIYEKETDCIIFLTDKSKIVVSFEDEISEILERFSSVREELNKENGTSTIEYLDLRFGNKVFLKRK